MARERAVGSVMPPSIPYEPSHITSYVVMVEHFLGQRIPVEEFEAAYMRTFLGDGSHWPEPIYLILNENFLDVGAFYPDPTIRSELDIDEAALRNRVESSLAALHGIL